MQMSLSIVRILPRWWWTASKRFFTSKQLVYAENGDPLKVLQLKTVDLGEKVESRKVCIRWLAAPINPADINQIQGVYPIKPILPAVGGSEGLGEVEAVGDAVTDFTKGDRVIIIHSGVGTWQSFGFYDSEDLIKVDNDLPLEVGATLQVNPPTAYRMLSDFATLHPGDVVVQNGATSTVGRAVIQIAHARGLQTVNLIRKANYSEELVKELKSLGADEVYAEEELLSQLRGKVKNAKLALNCIGGRSTLILAGCLGRNGVLVTYGGMSKQPLQIPTGPLIFKKIELKGFWMTEWYSNPKNNQKRNEMFKDIISLFRQGKFRPPNLDKRGLDDWQTAFKKASSSGTNKQMFVM